MKKVFLSILATFVALISFSSCEEIETSVYWIEFQEGSTNFNANLYLQAYVTNEVQFDPTTQKNAYTGTESEAIQWFDGKMASLKGDIKLNGQTIPILENTSASFSLVTSSWDDDYVSSKTKKVKTEKVNFKEQHIY